MNSDDLAAARKAMIEKRFGGNANGAKVQNGGAGSMRMKAKGAHKSGGDDLKLGSVLKKMALQPLNAIEEVNIFKADGNVVHIVQPKIQASTPSNTFVVTGTAETKPLQELLPGILHQLGPESMERLRSYAQQMSSGGMGGAGGIPEGNEDDDEEVPELVENFEEAAK
jgi:nascent polypeptide-associated complex subunit beta